MIVLRADGKEVIPAHDAGIKRLVLSAAHGLLVSLSYDRTLCLWDVSGDLPTRVDKANLPDDVWPRSCAFTAGTTLIFGTFGATYQTYDYECRSWGSSSVPPTYGVNAACAYQGGVLAVGDAGIVWRDDVAHASTGSLCNFLTPATDAVITGGQLGNVFDALTGTVLHQHRSPLNCGSRFWRNGIEHVLVGTYTGEGILLRIDSRGVVEHVRDLRLHANAVKGVAVSGDLIFSVSADTSATWQSATTLETIKVLPDAHDRIANGCVGLGSGRFASVSRDLKLRLWEPNFTKTVVNTPHTHSIKCVAAGTEGRLVATGSYDGHVAVYDRYTNTWPTIVRPTAAGISSLSYDAERRRFLASSYDGTIYPVTGELT
ncbi:MAG: WD40 repeat domain-containing protein [Pseudonocardiaceae bacterium]